MLPEAFRIGKLGGDNAVHRAFAAYVLYERAGIYAFNGYNIVGFQIIGNVPGGLHAAVAGRDILADQAADFYRFTFDIFFLHTIIADVGAVHDEQLAGVRRVGKYFLVAGHAGIEAYLSPTRATRPE